MTKPDFKNGLYIIKDYGGRKLELSEKTWNHIIIEKNRSYFERFFENIVQTIERPNWVKASKKEQNVVMYIRRFDDFYIIESVLGRAYIHIVVNWNTNRIRTAYPSITPKKGRVLWPKQKSKIK